jgi:uncharacterized protein YggE
MRWIAIGLIAVFALALPAGAQVPESGRQQIVVNGVGRVEVLPDQALATVGVQLQRRTAAEAMDEANRITARIIARLEEMGLRREDMRTSAIQISPVHRGGRGDAPPEIVGYQASHALTLTLRDVDAVGRAIDAAVEAGANAVFGVSFELRDPSRARNAALRLAVRDARSRAEAIARAAGLRIVGIERIVEAEAEVRPFLVGAAAVGALPMPTPVEPGMVVVSARIKIVFRY